MRGPLDAGKLNAVAHAGRKYAPQATVEATAKEETTPAAAIENSGLLLAGKAVVPNIVLVNTDRSSEAECLHSARHRTRITGQRAVIGLMLSETRHEQGAGCGAGTSKRRRRSDWTGNSGYGAEMPETAVAGTQGPPPPAECGAVLVRPNEEREGRVGGVNIERARPSRKQRERVEPAPRPESGITSPLTQLRTQLVRGRGEQRSRGVELRRAYSVSFAVTAAREEERGDENHMNVRLGVRERREGVS